MRDKINYKGKGAHSVMQLEQLVEQYREELHQIKSQSTGLSNERIDFESMQFMKGKYVDDENVKSMIYEAMKWTRDQIVLKEATEGKIIAFIDEFKESKGKIWLYYIDQGIISVKPNDIVELLQEFSKHFKAPDTWVSVDEPPKVSEQRLIIKDSDGFAAEGRYTDDGFVWNDAGDWIKIENPAYYMKYPS